MTCWLLTMLLAVGSAPTGHPDDLNVRAGVALRQAVAAMAKLAVGGGQAQVVELASGRRLAGRELGPTEFAVGPDGTVAAGWACLAAFEATGEPAYRDAAVTVAHALAATQLESGGWPVTADPAGRAYTRSLAQQGEPRGDRSDESQLAEPITPEALRFLTRVADLCGDQDAAQAGEYGVLSLLRIQRPDGAWPAVWPPRGDDARQGVMVGPLGAVTPAILRLLHQAKLAPANEAAHRAGEWLLRTRGPAGWDDSPAATAAGLLALAELHGDGTDRRYLAAARDILAHRPATTPELKTAAAAIAAAARGRTTLDTSREARAWRTAQHSREVAQVLSALNGDGLWVEDGQVRTATFAANVTLLAAFVRDYEPLPEAFTTDPERAGPHRL